MTVQENEKSEGKQVYVEGLKRYQKRGIRVLIDGVDASDATWEKLFEVREDGVSIWGIIFWRIFRRKILRARG